MSKKKKQHIIPEVFLKQFRIDDAENKSFVYCINFEDPFRTGVYKRGVGDKIFWRKNFYTDFTNDEPYLVEDFLGNSIEPTYPVIVSTLNKEQDITLETRKNLLRWMYMALLRSSHFRDLTKMAIPSKTSVLKKTTLQSEEVRLSKDIQLSFMKFDGLIPRQFAERFETSIVSKRWTIIKSKEELPFIGNDNPGLTIDLGALDSQERPKLGKGIILNANTLIYFVLSSHFCLEIRPFDRDTPPWINAFNDVVNYEQAGTNLITTINELVVSSRKCLIFASKKTLLEQYRTEDKSN